MGAVTKREKIAAEIVARCATLSDEVMAKIKAPHDDYAPRADLITSAAMLLVVIEVEDERGKQ